MSEAPDSQNSDSNHLAVTKALVSMLLAISIVVFLLWFTGRKRDVPEIKGGLPISTLTNAKKEAFFKTSVDPILAANRAANLRALETFKQNVHADFEEYRTRVPNFVEDITGFGNKTKIMWETAKEIGSKDKEKVERHVTEKFNLHVVSAEQIGNRLGDHVQAFQQDIEANRNEMLASIDAAVRNDPAFAMVGIAPSETFRNEIDTAIKAVSTKAGMDGAIVGGMSLLAGVAVEETVRLLTTAICARVGAAIGGSMAATATTAGGTTATGAAAGGGTGSLGGPLGTAIGVGVGLLAGVTVDWIMTDRLESKLKEQCTAFLTATEQAIISDAQGLCSHLEKGMHGVEDLQSPIFRKQLGILP